MASPPPGFRAFAVSAGIGKRPRLDLGLLVADQARPAAAVFTTSRLLGAHVRVAREHLAESGGRVRAVLVNSGNANCSTGPEGVADNRRVAAALAEALGCPPAEVLFLSTGVIGARLPVERILAALPALVAPVAPVDGDAADDPLPFARAVMTTDTVPKLAERPGVLGIAKGSGMIHPDLATMLAWLVTSRPLPPDPGVLLRAICERTFQRLTVDGDTSPNDTVLLWGTDGARDRAPDPTLEADLEAVARELARAIARDGEGATRLVTVVVSGAPDEPSAARVGRTIATSPLVKTAVLGRDPNWGRILAAAARADVAFDPDLARVWIGPATLYAGGRPQPEHEPAAHRHMADEDEVELGIDLGAGEASAEVWTCDLSADYVRINADYRT